MNDTTIVIYGKDDCPNCVKAKLLCQMAGVPFEYLTLGKEYSAQDLHEKVGATVRSVPQIFVREDGKDRHLGGANALTRLSEHLRSQA